MSKRTAKRAQSQAATAAKFPLWKHPSGRWAKKASGKCWYLGKVADDPEGKAALGKWNAGKDWYLLGKRPPVEGEGRLTVLALCNAYTKRADELVQQGGRAGQYLRDVLDTGKRILAAFGRQTIVETLGPSDFAKLGRTLARGLAPSSRRMLMQRIRAFFAWAYKTELLERPMRYGPDFVVSLAELRRHREKARAAGPWMFTSEELRAITAAADPQMRAMILLGVNAGYGPADVGRLEMQHVDLGGGLATLAREKTGVARRCLLWPETVDAIRKAIAQRRKPRNKIHASLMFLNRAGGPVWGLSKQRDPAKGRRVVDLVNKRFRAALARIGIKRQGGSFYSLRRTFRTIADELADVPAIDLIMGHVDGSMGGAYRQKIDDARLRAVVDHVRAWLFASEKTK